MHGKMTIVEPYNKMYANRDYKNDIVRINLCVHASLSHTSTDTNTNSVSMDITKIII